MAERLPPTRPVYAGPSPEVLLLVGVNGTGKTTTAAKHPVQIALVLDACGGQNGVLQARAFLEGARCNQLVLTKLDGTSRGGFVLAAVSETGLPVTYVGTGEGVDDLEPFEPKRFARALVGLD